jgi:hypothetical protein
MSRDYTKSVTIIEHAHSVFGFSSCFDHDTMRRRDEVECLRAVPANLTASVASCPVIP